MRVQGALAAPVICSKIPRCEHNFSHAIPACGFIGMSLRLATVWLCENDD
jgi:hypothetical protein